MTSYAPDVYRCKLRYNTNFALSASPAADSVFSGNGIYDPDISGVGSQPLGFDQLMNIYTRYRVKACKATLEYANTNTTLPTSITVYPSISSSSPTTLIETLSLPYSKYVMTGDADGTSKSKMLQIYMSTKRIFGVNSVSQEVAYTGDDSNNPANQWYWHIYYTTISETGSATVQGIIRFTYYVEFYNRKQVAIS